MSFGKEKRKAECKFIDENERSMPKRHMMSPIKMSYGERGTPIRNIERYHILSQIQSPVKNSESSPKKDAPFSPRNTNQNSQTVAEEYGSPIIPQLAAQAPFTEKEDLRTLKSEKIYSALLKNEIFGTEIESLDQLDSHNKIIDMQSPQKKSTGPARRRLFENSVRSPSKCERPRQQLFPESPNQRSMSLSSRLLLASSSKSHQISKTPYKILDAPDLADDFYLNLLDWSCKDSLAVGLGTAIYLWNATSSQVTCLADLANCEDQVTSVSFNERGDHLAVGTKKGNVHLWDIQKLRKISITKLHSERIGVISWRGTSIATGSRDRTIAMHDLRSSSRNASNLETNATRIQFHAQEVCGLKWSPNHMQLASGGNDNNLCVWSHANVSRPLHNFTQHIAAVKAIGWSHVTEGLLASGGGTMDKTLRFWNTLTGNLLHSVNTGSQVCSLLWSKHSNDIVSVHGYSQNHIAVWKYPQMELMSTMVGHSTRVLYLTGSPCGKYIVTGAGSGDETIRFWEVFETAKERKIPECSLEPRLQRF